jgi:hypothetical protein
VVLGHDGGEAEQPRAELLEVLGAERLRPFFLHCGDRCAAPIRSVAADAGDIAFLAIATPGLFGRAYFQELSVVLDTAQQGTPDPEAVTAVMLRHGLTPAPHPVA